MSQSIRVCASAAILQEGALLLVEYQDESGLHYNFPGGGVEAGESLHEAACREAWEEAGAEVTVGRLLLTWEYVPSHYAERYGPTPKVGFLFACTLKPGSVPSMPDPPDCDTQTGIRWVPLADLPDLPLLPQVGSRLREALASAEVFDPFCPDW